MNPDRKKLYYNISEVSRLTGVKPHVLRYWETEFPDLQPLKDRANRRLYRKEDIELIQTIKKLLYQEKFTVKGARKQLQELKGRFSAGDKSRVDGRLKVLRQIKSSLFKLISEFEDNLSRIDGIVSRE